MLRKLMQTLSPQTALGGDDNRSSPLGYSALYEEHAKAQTSDQATGDGDFEHIGLLELEILKDFGLTPDLRLLDFGCGIGRLARHALSFLNSGNYWGVDIAPTMLERAKEICGSLSTQGNWLCGDGGVLNTVQGVQFDRICAFSVFTHVDLEEYYTHLQCMRRVVRVHGRLLTSHLLLHESERAREIFTMSSALPYEIRRGRVLNIVTSRELIETVASMSSWKLLEWVSGEEKRFVVGPNKIPSALGQAIAVLAPA